MSRIGRKPVQIPAGVEVTVNGNTCVVKGPKGTLQQDFHENITVTVEENEVIVDRANDERESRAQHGLTRALIQNMVTGVSRGLHQVPRARWRWLPCSAWAGTSLDFSLGYSHPVVVEAPEGITFEVPDNTHINVKGINKQQVGQIAAEIRAKRPPEPYKGKGIHYVGEHIRRKLGKAAK